MAMQCVIEVESVEMLPFDVITIDHVIKEGEKNMAVSRWKRVYKLKCFHGEKVRAGLVFNETIKVIFRGLERFCGQMIIKPKGKLNAILKFNIDNIMDF